MSIYFFMQDFSEEDDSGDDLLTVAKPTRQTTARVDNQASKTKPDNKTSPSSRQHS